MQLPKRNNASPIPAEGIERLVARFPQSPALAKLQAAVATASAEYKSLMDACKRIEGDSTRTAGAKLVLQAKLAESKMSTVSEKIGAAKAETKAAIDRINNVIAGVFDFSSNRHIAEVLGAQEVRAYFRGLPAVDRMAAVGEAMKSYDIQTLVALGAGATYLSGINDDMHARVREHVLSVLAPEAIPARATLTEGLAAAELIEQTVAQSVANAVDTVTAAEIEQASAAAA